MIDLTSTPIIILVILGSVGVALPVVVIMHANQRLQMMNVAYVMVMEVLVQRFHYHLMD